MNNENVNIDEYDIKKQPIFDDIVNIKDESVRKKVRPSTEEIDELFDVENPQVRERYNNFHLNLFFEFIIRLLELIEPKKKKITPKDEDEYKLKLIIMTGQFLKPYLDSKHKEYLAEGLLPFLGELRHYKALLTVNNTPYIKLMRELEQHFELNDLEEFNLDKRERLGSDLERVEIPPPPPPEDSNLYGNLNSNGSLSAEGRIRRKKNKKKGSVKHGNVKRASSGSNASKKKRKRKSKNLRK